MTPHFRSNHHRNLYISQDCMTICSFQRKKKTPAFDQRIHHDAHRNLTGSLVGVLVRFRQELLALMADIQSMLHHVNVSEEHMDFMRLLWCPDGKIEQGLVEHRMTVQLFGAVSLPAVHAWSQEKQLRITKLTFQQKYS